MNLKNTLLVQCVLLPLLFFLSACATAKEPKVELSVDRQLIQSLKNDDYELSRSLLERGANPEAVLGNNWNDHAVCLAIDDRTSKNFELLVEYGASPDSIFPIKNTLYKTPLACAISYYNPEVFDYLLKNGATPDVDLCPHCDAQYYKRWTALTAAVTGKKYPFAVKLINKYTPHENEIAFIKYSLERFPFDEAHPWNDARDELIQWMFNHGVENFNPMAAGKPVNGVIHECVAFFRDYEEGLSKGTICRE